MSLLDDIPLHAPEPETQSTHYTVPDTLNIKDELKLRYTQASNLYEEIKTDADTPPNQKAQVLNTMTSILGQLTKLEAELHSIEQVKRIEAAIIRAMKLAPEEVQTAFLKNYEAELEKSTL